MKKIPTIIRSDSALAFEGRVYSGMENLRAELDLALSQSDRDMPHPTHIHKNSRKSELDRSVNRLIELSFAEFLSRPSLLERLFQDGGCTLALETERLFLTSFTWEDLPGIHAYSSDSEVVRYQEWGPNSLQETSDFLRQCIMAQMEARRHVSNLGVRLRESGQVIGGMMISESLPYGQIEVGFSFARAYWNKGYASEATRALVALLFSNPDVKLLTATADVRNLASIQVLTKAGFCLKYTWPNHKRLRSGPRDTAFMECASPSR